MCRLEENPAFHDFSLVYLPYCSSDVYTGTREGSILTQVVIVVIFIINIVIITIIITFFIINFIVIREGEMPR